mmetsp:Transcript_40128/g.84262  ORF Transcript_40128/g.84262 Transcript_40128/m.84262 type:complete len:410 (+) Transcript_40128:185-1414(+)|eukprot:CAMPEP_0183730458 /NCGR_PEP_ID=MMETSP0737-20130205/32901_1 /TAXON_ID=385413 /ORGANISM="Thalassiosira miniscula, Strain CCMP1093" /LENGTH=409 /DNA_ID=CAMNT_0025962969 /DNA_START=123 /DNA_END=1352 /DNA_ORIENTATION=-
MSEHNSGGGGPRRPPFPRSNNGGRSVTDGGQIKPSHSALSIDNRRKGTSKGTSKTVFTHNKVKQNQTLKSLLELQWRLERTTQDATNGPHTELMERSGEVIEVLSSLQDIIAENDSTIQNLQHQLVDVTNERDVARRNSDKLENDLRTERKNFANVSHKQKREHQVEVEGLKRKANKLGKRCKQMECQLKLKEEAIKLFEVSQVMRNLGTGATAPTTDTTGTASLEGTTFDEGETRSSATFEATLNEGEQNSSPQAIEKMRIDYWKNKYETVRSSMRRMENLNDELVDKIAEISDVNRQLVTKCEWLEDKIESSNMNMSPLDRARSLDSSPDIQTGTVALDQSMEEAIEFANEKLAIYYEEKLAKMKEEFHESVSQSSRVASDAFALLRRRRGAPQQAPTNIEDKSSIK